MRQRSKCFLTSWSLIALLAILPLLAGCGVSFSQLMSGATAQEAEPETASAKKAAEPGKTQASDAVVTVLDGNERVIAATGAAHATTTVPGYKRINEISSWSSADSKKNSAKASYLDQTAIEPVSSPKKETSGSNHSKQAVAPQAEAKETPSSNRKSSYTKRDDKPAAKDPRSMAKISLKAGGNSQDVYLECNRPYALSWNPFFHKAEVEERDFVSQDEVFLKATSPREVIVFAANRQEKLKPGWVAQIPSVLSNGAQINTVITLLANN